jgi:transcriptional regulator with XRE-family HTH domain
MPLDIKNIRSLTGLNQKDFGERIGLNERQVRRRESGETEWTVTELLNICREFDLDLELKGLSLKG